MMDKYLNLNQKDLKLVIFRFPTIHLVQVSLDASFAFYFDENCYYEKILQTFELKLKNHERKFPQATKMGICPQKLEKMDASLDNKD